MIALSLIQQFLSDLLVLSFQNSSSFIEIFFLTSMSLVSDDKNT